jgi:hypothetical protein
MLAKKSWRNMTSPYEPYYLLGVLNDRACPLK